MFEFDGTGTLTSKLNGLPVLGYLPDATGNISSNTTQLKKIQITEEVRSITLKPPLKWF